MKSDEMSTVGEIENDKRDDATLRRSQYLRMIYNAWMTPGIQPKIVRRILIKRSAWHPRSKKTPRGGRKMAKRILQMSEPVAGIFVCESKERRGARDAMWVGDVCL